ncbi:MAG: methylmalonyl-CoA mutase family protein [Bacteroidetes bacterium]|nr:methylmalonyl-CoA mutase family protein [Bacteroidota bacterium]
MSEASLFSEFENQTEAEWKAKILKDLRGKAFEELLSTNADGFEIQPIYTAESSPLKNQPLKEHPKWDNVMEILVLDAKAANTEALMYLNKGATSLLFYLPGKVDLEVLLKAIELPYICTNLVIEGDINYYVEALKQLINTRGYQEEELEGSINFDPIENLARTGDWFKDEQSDLAALAQLNEAHFKGFRTLCLNTNLFANAGASIAQQLGIALAMAYEYSHQLQLNGSRGFWVNFAINSDYFGEIAKLRAFRRIWAQWQIEMGFPQDEVRIYAESALRNKSILDKHNNLIRTTAEAMSAVIGGATEICVKGFGEPLEDQGFFPRRLALNQLSMLQHEGRLDQVRDMAAGNYWVEKLTEDYASAGWNFFKQIEAEGGLIASLKEGWLQAEIARIAAAEQGRFDAGDLKLIGVNYYRKDQDTFSDELKAKLRSSAPSDKATAIEKVRPQRLAENLERDIILENSAS